MHDFLNLTQKTVYSVFLGTYFGKNKEKKSEYKIYIFKTKNNIVPYVGHRVYRQMGRIGTVLTCFSQ